MSIMRIDKTIQDRLSEIRKKANNGVLDYEKRPAFVATINALEVAIALLQKQRNPLRVLNIVYKPWPEVVADEANEALTEIERILKDETKEK